MFPLPKEILSESRQQPELRLLRPDADILPLDALDLDEAAISSRFDWAVRQGHPGYLWPELPIHAWRACQFELERVVGRVLAGESGVRLELPPEVTARALGITAFTSGTGPLLGFWLESGLLASEPGVRRLLALHLEHNRLRMTRFRVAIEQLTMLLGAERIPMTVIKGGCTAFTLFPDPGMRPMADIDFVVRPADVQRTAELLRAAGYESTVRQRRPFKCDWLPPDAPRRVRSLEVTHCDDPFSIEMHSSLDRAFDGVRTVQLGPVMVHAAPWREMGEQVFRLREPANLALLALHLSEELHHLQLLRVVEFVLVLRRNYADDPAAWGDLTALLERARAQRFVYPAFELAERLAPGCVDATFRRMLARHAHPRLVRVVDGLRPGSAQRLDRLTLEEGMLWAHGPWDNVKRAAYMIWPLRAGHSRRPLRSIYRERIYRLLRGRFSVRSEQPM